MALTPHCSPRSCRFFSAILMATALLAVAVVSGGCAPKKPAAAAPRTFAFWPALPNEPHVQFLTSYETSADIQVQRSRFDVMLYGKQAAVAMTKPYGVAMRDGKIYLCDVRTPGIIVLDLPKRIARIMGAGGAGAVQKGADIAIAPDGTKYVADQTRSGIVVFDAQDHFVNFLAPRDLNPVSVAIHGNELFVCDFAGQTIKVLDPATGQVLRTIGSAGTGDGQFVRPLCVRIDRQGHLLVTDVIRCRILRFNRDGTFINAFGETGDRPGCFVRPKHMALDSSGLLYVVDAAFSNVQIFDEEDKILDFFGSPGAHPGAMQIPAGIYISEDPADLALFKDLIHPAFEAERLVIVTNQFGPNRVAIYAQGQLRPGKTVADITPSRAKIESGIVTGDNQSGSLDATAQPTTSPGRATEAPADNGAPSAAQP